LSGRWLILVLLVWMTGVGMAAAGGPCELKHPLAPPDATLTGRCPNCGMPQAMWARTWKTFASLDGATQACSFHCLAEMALKSGATPTNVQTALYQQPRVYIAAAAASYVIGARVPGTMTSQSKLAFPSLTAATQFADACGGRVVDYSAVLAAAAAALPEENRMIDQRRRERGVIGEPQELKDECPVCRMYPARYPKSRAQRRSSDGQVVYYCSTHCLFAVKQEAAPRETMIWVTDYASGRWISAFSAYYVVASTYQGPMGTEAVAFDRRTAAETFMHQHGGQVVGYRQAAAIQAGRKP